MFALVHTGSVVQIEADQFPVHEALSWVDITGESPMPQVGWSYDGAVFTAPPTPPAPPSDADQAEFEFRGNKALLALGRIATGDNALTLDALVVLARGKL